MQKKIYAFANFRNAEGELMPLGTPSGGFGLPMGNSGRDSYQNAVGMGNSKMVAPAFGGTQTPSTLAIKSKRCMTACNKTGLQGVFINGNCYCVEQQVYGEWVKTHFNFNNAIGGCTWLFCPEGYTRVNCRCVENKDLPKSKKKKLGLDFSNFLNNPFAKKTTAMTDKKCRRICNRSQHIPVLVDGTCICASVNDIADFQKDKGFHNAVSGRACREQVRCPNGYEATMVGLNCQCVKKAENVSAAFRLNNLK